MKSVFLWISAIFGIGLIAFFSCKPESKPEDNTKFNILYKGELSGKQSVDDYCRVCRDEQSYRKLCENFGLSSNLSGEIDFSRYQVLGIVDTMRPYPTYGIDVSCIVETDEFLEVQVAREYEIRDGAPTQSYVVIRMPKTEKPIRFVNMPFEREELSLPGVTKCLNDGAKQIDKECFHFKFTEEGKLVIVHQNVELNCMETMVETSVVQDGLRLVIKEEERLGPDGKTALCWCLKHVTYLADVVGGNDSLQVDFHVKTLDRTWPFRSFKIPGKGRGSVYISAY